jgi:hypothetical protein
MENEWYYAEGDQTVGPASIEEIARRIGRAKGPLPLVWKPGLPEWTDASILKDFLTASQSPATLPVANIGASREMKRPLSSGPATLVRRAREELIEYLSISAYLYVCFGSVLLYKAAILRGEGIEYAAFGVAIVKALILGKFLLVLHALKMGERGPRSGTLLASIIKKSVLFALLLIVMTVVEEMIAGYFHGRAIQEILHDIGGGTLPSAFATGELLLLILIPYFAFREIGASLGEGGLAKFLMERRSFESRK